MMKFEIFEIKNTDEALFRQAFSNMSESRRQRCLRYKSEADRRRMALGDMLAKKLISEAYRCSAKSISLENLPSGKPKAYVGDKEIFISISHSGDFVACALSTATVGIDIEVKREVSDGLARRALSRDEYAYVTAFEGDFSAKEQNEAFFRIWTAKEAYLKLTGEGLAGLEKAQVLPLVLSGEGDGLFLEYCCTAEYVCTVVFKNNIGYEAP